jgi:hypothetical protein
MARKKDIGRKRRTREHVIADLSANHVERHALLCGHSVERVAHDYGTDLWIATYNREGELENGEIRVQLKATDHVKLISGGRFIALRVDRKDLDFWVEQTMPFILILYDAQADRAFWLYVQAHFAGGPGLKRKRAGARVTVRIPTANVVSPAAIEMFAEYRNKVVAQTKGVDHRG